MVLGGSGCYSKRFRDFLEQHRNVRFLTGCETRMMKRAPDCCQLRVVSSGVAHELECAHCVLATHPNQALDVLGTCVTVEERAILSGFKQQGGSAVLHQDARWMPPDQTQWAGMNRVLPAVESPQEWSDTLTTTRCNPCNLTEQTVFVTYSYGNVLPIDGGVQGPQFEHPVLSARTVELRRQMREIQGFQAVQFAGSYLSGISSHEDAVSSGLQAANRIMRGLHTYPIIPRWHELHAKGEWLDEPKISCIKNGDSGSEQASCPPDTQSPAGVGGRCPGLVSTKVSEQSVQMPSCAAVKAQIHSLVCAKVSRQDIGDEDSLQGVGLTSIKAAELAGELGDALGTSLSPSVLYEHPTIASSAKYLTTKLVVDWLLSSELVDPGELASMIEPAGSGVTPPPATTNVVDSTSQLRLEWESAANLVLAAREGAAEAFLMLCKLAVPSWADVQPSEFSVIEIDTFLKRGNVFRCSAGTRVQLLVKLNGIDDKLTAAVHRSWSQLGVVPGAFCLGNDLAPGLEIFEFVQGGESGSGFLSNDLDADAFGVMLAEIHSLPDDWYQPCRDFEKAGGLLYSWLAPQEVLQTPAQFGEHAAIIASIQHNASSLDAEQGFQALFSAANEVSAELHSLLEPTSPMGRLVVGHGDAHPGNILRRAAGTHGNLVLIDLELVGYIPAAIDLAAPMSDDQIQSWNMGMAPGESLMPSRPRADSWDASETYPLLAQRRRVAKSYLAGCNLGANTAKLTRTSVDEVVYDMEIGAALRSLFVAVIVVVSGQIPLSYSWAVLFFARSAFNLFVDAKTDAGLAQQILQNGVAPLIRTRLAAQGFILNWSLGINDYETLWDRFGSAGPAFPPREMLDSCWERCVHLDTDGTANQEITTCANCDTDCKTDPHHSTKAQRPASHHEATESVFQSCDALVVGAGIVGLCFARDLASVGYSVVVVEKSEGIGGTWRTNDYPGLRLHQPGATYRCLSLAPDWTKQHDADEWYRPTREEIMAYIEQLAAHPLVSVLLNCEYLSRRQEHGQSGFVVTTSTAEVKSRFVFESTGCFLNSCGAPRIPTELDALHAGELGGPGCFHSSQLSPEVFSRVVSSNKVVVVGSGKAAIDMLHQLKPGPQAIWAHRGHTAFMARPKFIADFSQDGQLFQNAMIEFTSKTGSSTEWPTAALEAGWLISCDGPITTKAVKWGGGLVDPEELEYANKFDQLHLSSIDACEGSVTFRGTSRCALEEVTVGPGDCIALCTGQGIPWTGLPQAEAGYFRAIPFTFAGASLNALVPLCLALEHLRGCTPKYHNVLSSSLQHLGVDPDFKRLRGARAIIGALIHFSYTNVIPQFFPKISTHNFAIRHEWVGEWYGLGLAVEDTLRSWGLQLSEAERSGRPRLVYSDAAQVRLASQSHSAPFSTVHKLFRQPSDITTNQSGVAVIGQSCKTCVGSLGWLWPALIRQQCWITQAPAQRWSLTCESSACPDLRSFGSFIDERILCGLKDADGVEIDPHMLMLFDAIADAMADARLDRTLLKHEYKSICVFTAVNVRRFTVPLAHFAVARSVASKLGVDCRYDNMDAACSSGYLALQQGLDHIKTGGCHRAIIGGASLELKAESQARKQSRSISRSGIMRPLEAQADGMAPAEATSAVILQQDVAAGMAHTSLVGWASTRCSTQLPLGFCDPASIAAAAAGALSCAGLEASLIELTHLHAMGSLGSDIPELQGCVQAFELGRRQNPPLALAGHKGCIGHSEHVAGLLGLITTCMVAQHNSIPGHVNIKEAVLLVRSVRGIALPTARPMRSDFACSCSISGTSLSGDNVHLILGQRGSAEHYAPSHSKIEALQQADLRQEYSYQPPLQELRSMTQEELRAVRNFRVERKGFGSLAWDEPVDLRRADVEKVQICRGGGRLDPAELPMLDRSCLVTAEGMLPAVPLSEDRVRAHAKNLRRQFYKTHECDWIGYDPRTGQLKFRISHFPTLAGGLGSQDRVDDERGFTDDEVSDDDHEIASLKEQLSFAEEELVEMQHIASLKESLRAAEERLAEIKGQANEESEGLLHNDPTDAGDLITAEAKTTLELPEAAQGIADALVGELVGVVASKMWAGKLPSEKQQLVARVTSDARAAFGDAIRDHLQESDGIEFQMADLVTLLERVGPKLQDLRTQMRAGASPPEDFSGEWVKTAVEGDPSQFLKELGYSGIARKVAAKFDYGVGDMQVIDQQGDMLTIKNVSGMAIGRKPVEQVCRIGCGLCDAVCPVGDPIKLELSWTKRGTKERTVRPDGTELGSERWIDEQGRMVIESYKNGVMMQNIYTKK